MSNTRKELLEKIRLWAPIDTKLARTIVIEACRSIDELDAQRRAATVELPTAYAPGADERDGIATSDGVPRETVGDGDA